MYSGMTAMNPAIIRVVTRKGSDGMPITSRASISSEMRMAPSWAVKPEPTVADRADAAPLLRYDLEVDGRDDEVEREQQHERDDDALVDRVAHALRPALRGHSLVGGDHRGDDAEHRCLDLAGDQVGELAERLEARQ